GGGARYIEGFFERRELRANGLRGPAVDIRFVREVLEYGCERRCPFLDVRGTCGRLLREAGGEDLVDFVRERWQERARRHGRLAHHVDDEIREAGTGHRAHAEERFVGDAGK